MIVALHGNAFAADLVVDGDFSQWPFSILTDPPDDATATREPAGDNPGAHLRIATNLNGSGESQGSVSSQGAGEPSAPQGSPGDGFGQDNKLSCGGSACVVSGSGRILACAGNSCRTQNLAGATPQSNVACDDSGCIVSGSASIVACAGNSCRTQNLVGATTQSNVACGASGCVVSGVGRIAACSGTNCSTLNLTDSVQ
jgi:hypothetical protein